MKGRRKVQLERDLVTVTRQVALLTDLLTIQDEQLGLIQDGGELTATLLLDFQRATEATIKRLDARADDLTDAFNQEHFRVNRILYGAETARKMLKDRRAQRAHQHGAQSFAQEQPGID